MQLRFVCGARSTSCDLNMHSLCNVLKEHASDSSWLLAPSQAPGTHEPPTSAPLFCRVLGMYSLILNSKSARKSKPFDPANPARSNLRGFGL